MSRQARRRRIAKQVEYCGLTYTGPFRNTWLEPGPDTMPYGARKRLMMLIVQAKILAKLLPLKGTQTIPDYRAAAREASAESIRETTQTLNYRWLMRDPKDSRRRRGSKGRPEALPRLPLPRVPVPRPR